MHITETALNINTDIEMQSTFHVTRDGIVEIAIDIVSSSETARHTAQDVNEINIELSALIDSFIEDVLEDDPQEAIRDLYTMANEFERYAEEFRERAGTMEERNDTQLELFL